MNRYIQTGNMPVHRQSLIFPEIVQYPVYVYFPNVIVTITFHASLLSSPVM